MMNTQTAIGPTLLPYLDSRKERISIQFVHSKEPIPIGADNGGNEGPISLMRHGRVVIDSHHCLMEVVFITPSDYCTSSLTALRPLSNQGMDDIWQQSWARIKSRGDEQMPAVLPCQIDDSGALMPLRPLFYCSYRDVYCHPPCPFCARPLDLCRNDDLLAQSGLPTYKNSLHRYLYCARCHDVRDGAYFYTIDRNNASPYVKDGNALIKSFRRLLTSPGPSDQWPCIECDDAPNCYGSEMKALDRMQPFQFYPFHMFMQKAPALGAVEFLSLVAGAQKSSHPESADHGFFFKRDDRWFIEILYLKLTFLYELVLLIKNDPFFPVGRMSLDSIGVDMPLQGANLPHFWNFSLRSINPIASPVYYRPGAELSLGLACEFLGHAWFLVLLVNAKQTMVEINSTVDRHLGQCIGQAAAEEKLYRHHEFGPGNIFWQPRPLELPSGWDALWVEALNMGMGLLHAGGGGRSDVSLALIETQIKKLRDRAHLFLFNAPAGVKEQKNISGDGNDAHIAQILSVILKKWPQTHLDPDVGPGQSCEPSSNDAPKNKFKDGTRRSQNPEDDRAAPNATPNDESMRPNLDTPLKKTMLISPGVHGSDGGLDNIMLKSEVAEKHPSSDDPFFAGTVDTDLADHTADEEIKATVVVRVGKSQSQGKDKPRKV